MRTTAPVDRNVNVTKLLISCLATAALVAGAASAQTEPPVAPESSPRVEVIRDVMVIDKNNAPHLLKVQRGYFGISTLDLTSELLEHFGVDAGGGVLVSSVAADGPAAQAGISVGDILVEVDGEPIESRFDASVVIGRLEPESQIYAKVYRKGRAQTLEVEVGERERGQVPLNWVMQRSEDVKVHPGAYEYRFRLGQDGEEVVILNTDHLQEAADRMRERFDSPEYRARFEAFRDRNSELEVRLQEMEERLAEMGARLAEALQQIQRQNED